MDILGHPQFEPDNGLLLVGLIGIIAIYFLLSAFWKTKNPIVLIPFVPVFIVSFSYLLLYYFRLNNLMEYAIIKLLRVGIIVLLLSVAGWAWATTQQIKNIQNEIKQQLKQLHTN